MDDFSASPPPERLSRLSAPEGREAKVSRAYSGIIRSLRFILPIFALILTVIVVTWEEGGRSVEPLKRAEVMPESENTQNELLKPVFNSVDDKNQPYTVTADRAVQSRGNPDIVELEKPVADLKMNDGTVISGDANTGLYEQKSQKLNLEGNVHVRNSDGVTLSTEELRIDMVQQKTYSGRDVLVESPDGTIHATGLEGDVSRGSLIFTGPAKVILYSNGNILSPKAKTQ